MSFVTCLLIPIYNHKESIRNTVKRLATYKLPIFIVDDGSDKATQAVLAELAAKYPLIRLFRLPKNGGKGAAVMHGMREAYQVGFSHALQIDADGQHDIDDVPRFLERAIAYPEALICGKPIYDASIPKSRLYGRYITHFWVWVETLSFAVGDSMCGFRLYPLASTCALIDTVKIPTRMDFDIAIMVRLSWRGVQFENIPTHVIYPPDGLSHFNVLFDNLRITKMHTCLTCGMLMRLPLLLRVKFSCSGKSSTHWSRLAERGSALGLRTIFACYRLLGERVAQLILYPIVGYFFLTGRKARTASLDYLRRVHASNSEACPDPGWRESFCHILAFAQSGLDKLAAWMGGMNSSRIVFPNRAEFDHLLASGHGAVLIGSHLGNIEMARALATDEQRATINAVVYTDHAQRFNQILHQANANFSTNLIQVSHLGPETAIMLKNKIDHGELLVIVGDRTPPTESGHISEAEFLGHPALFAQGPFILASLLDCPVYLLFCLREGDSYRIYFEPFAECIKLPRRERQQQLQEYIQQYAQRLEAHCLMAPYQWFNFFDFWRREAAINTLKV